MHDATIKKNLQRIFVRILNQRGFDSYRFNKPLIYWNSKSICLVCS